MDRFHLSQPSRRGARPRSNLGALTLALAIASCSSDPPGLTIDLVPGDASTRHVRLLISDDLCTECPGVGPESPTGQNSDPSADILPGVVRVIADDAGAEPKDDVIDVDDSGVARFQLLPSMMPTGHRVHIVALGLDGEGVPIEMARVVLDDVPTSTYEQIELGPLTDRVTIWPVDGPYTCVELDKLAPDPDDPDPREFYVPAIDKDCDRLHDDDDCQKLDYEFVAPPISDSVATCAGSDKIDGNDGCYVGAGGECSDGVPAGECASITKPTQTCVPQSFCDDGTCASGLDPAACVGATSASLECSLIEASGEVCQIEALTFASQTCGSLAVETFGGAGIDLQGFIGQAQLLDAMGVVGVVSVIPSANGGASCNSETLQFSAAPDGSTGAAWVRIRLDNSDEVVPLIASYSVITDVETTCTSAAAEGTLSFCKLHITMGDSLETCAR